MSPLPIWLLFLGLSIAFTIGLFLGLPRRARSLLGPGTRRALRIGSTAALVLALMTVTPQNLLLPTVLAIVAGVLSGRTVEPPRR